MAIEHQTRPVDTDLKILIVDDEPGIRNVLRITLESAGYTIYLAGDGQEGFDMYMAQKPQIVISDIKMPGIDGISLLKEIKSLDPDTEVIMITGHGDMALAIKSLKYEAADFITKPIDSNDLETAILKAKERINISQNIRHYMDDLETLVEEKDKKINESESLVTIGMTIAGMSHAIKNIAGGLKGSSFVLEQGIEQENREVLRQGWEMMKGNINKITQLSLDLLNYAKTTRLNFALSDPNTPAQEIVSIVQHQAKEQNITFEFKPCQKETQVFMDKDAIQSCLLNLVTNAFDAFGADTHSDNRPPCLVSLTVNCYDKTVTYTVQDNGKGVKPAIRPILFNDFISTKGMKGTGFGLMTTKKIIGHHKGTVLFEPGKESGSIFTIKLPADQTI
jgi:signal transduction histidine kinase